MSFRVTSMSVSPAGNVWLGTAVGGIYFSNESGTEWHYGKNTKKQEGFYYTDLNSPSLETISFFNNDTIIMAGGMLELPGTDGNTGFLRSTNRGRSWDTLSFGGDEWIAEAVTDPAGNAWMTGHHGSIYYSNDFGKEWKKLNTPFTKKQGCNSLFMRTATEGIAGAFHNAIYVTEDNWKSSKAIPTPYDQKKYKSYDEEPQNRISKILIWLNYIVVSQDGYMYYSEIDKINWKEFPVGITGFELDPVSNELIAVTDSLNIVSFSCPTAYEPFTQQKLVNYPYELKIINHTVYGHTGSGDVYKIERNGIQRLWRYTNESGIPKPEIIRDAGNKKWGLNKYQLLLSDDTTWYREDILPVLVLDFRLIDDKTAIFWAADKKNYKYLLPDHRLSPYEPVHPIEAFIASPLKSFTIKSSAKGCFHDSEQEIKYERKDSKSFETRMINKKSLYAILSDNNGKNEFINSVSYDSLAMILRSIDANPLAIPSIADFRFTVADIKEYALVLDSVFSNKNSEYHLWKKLDKSFFKKVPDMLDKVDSKIIEGVLDKKDKYWSTSSASFDFDIVNDNNDTLHISKWFYSTSDPRQVAWKFEYKGQYFRSVNLDLTRFIVACLPDDWYYKRDFNNAYFLISMGELLYPYNE